MGISGYEPDVGLHEAQTGVVPNEKGTHLPSVCACFLRGPHDVLTRVPRVF